MSETAFALQDFQTAGAVGPLDAQVARALARIGGETDPLVLLGAALACRAPQRGHICADLTEIVAGPVVDRDDDDVEHVEAPTDPAPLAWPELQEWLVALQQSPLVHVADGTAPQQDAPPRPLVLDGHRLFLRRYARYQDRLLQALLHRATAEVPGIDTDLLRQGLHRLFPAHPDLAGRLDRQRVAAAMAVLRRLTVVSGGPGTGKTSTVKKILALLLEQDEQARTLDPTRPQLRIALAAPTGKAATRLRESLVEDLDTLETTPQVQRQLTDLQAYTLHKLLGFQRRTPWQFKHHAGLPLPHDVVVVDEASMVDFALMTKLVEAVPTHARLVLLGDRDQLASVEAGAVLADLCGDDRDLHLSAGFAAQLGGLVGVAVPAAAAFSGLGDCLVHLDHFYRFGRDSGIGTAARTLVGALDGELGGDTAQPIERRRADRILDLFGAGTPPGRADLTWLQPQEDRMPPAILATVVTHYQQVRELALAGRVPEALAALRGLCVLCAHRQGELGVQGVNQRVEAALLDRAPAGGGGHGRAPAVRAPYAGRPILVRENDYTMGLMNGDLGIVAHDPGRDGELRAFFPDGDGTVRSLPLVRLPAHDTNFAMTIHKSQGSQVDHAVVVLPSSASAILTRELLYTGLTRAQRHVTVVATAQAVRRAAAARVQRASGLAEKLGVVVSGSRHRV
jgi:exodeoxyribonuclease V alpha subunit